jgi:hypothetical protein
MPKKQTRTAKLENFQQKYSLPLAIALGLIGVIYFALTTYANEKLPFNISKELREHSCSNKVGDALISVQQKVANDLAQGEAGNNWATQDYDQKIKVWATNSANEYCAEVTFAGKFKTIVGQQSPGGNYIIEKSSKGELSGGYILNINSNKFEPKQSTSGVLEKLDLKCTSDGCAGSNEWITKYFPIYSSSHRYYGTIYKAGGGTNVWMNTMSGLYGDIQ